MKLKLHGDNRLLVTPFKIRYATKSREFIRHRLFYRKGALPLEVSYTATKTRISADLIIRRYTP